MPGKSHDMNHQIFSSSPNGNLCSTNNDGLLSFFDLVAGLLCIRRYDWLKERKPPRLDVFLLSTYTLLVITTTVVDKKILPLSIT
jgi:hypothetical protein